MLLLLPFPPASFIIDAVDVAARYAAADFRLPDARRALPLPARALPCHAFDTICAFCRCCLIVMPANQEWRWWGFFHLPPPPPPQINVICTPRHNDD